MNNSNITNVICSNNNENHIKLYNSVFNNIYLKKIILNHLNKFNILYNKIEFESLEQLQQFKYKQYLNNIKLSFLYYNLNELPDNIKNVHITFYQTNIEINKDQRIIPIVPNQLDSIEVTLYLNDFDEDSILNSFISKLSSEVLSKFKGLNICNEREISIKSIPLSVSKIYIQRLHHLKKNLLPINVKEIDLRDIESFEYGCLPESITSASLQYTNPLIINQFSLNGLVKLNFSCNYHIGNNIRFPNTLQNLTVYCDTFDTKLPDSLKSLTLILDIYKYEIIFPSSLEYLKVEIRNDQIIDPGRVTIQNKFSVQNNNFKTFELSLECSSIVDNNGKSIIPNKLTKLKINGPFNEELKANQLTSSLTYLDLGDSFDQVIDINVLPSNLKTLILGIDYTQIINPLAIPRQLESLKINNDEYEHPFRFTPSTHPNLKIDCSNLNLYYDSSDKSIRKLQLPTYDFNSPLSTLQLQDKSSLEYLHLGQFFNQPIHLSDLPFNNNIKKLVFGYRFKQTINLENFQKLETIFLSLHYNSFSDMPSITTTINKDGSYNYYNLKKILLPKIRCHNSQIFNSIDINFYHFINIIDNNNK